MVHIFSLDKMIHYKNTKLFTFPRVFFSNIRSQFGANIEYRTQILILTFEDEIYTATFFQPQ